MPKLTGHRYGKARVRVLKILREGNLHRIKDLNVCVLLQGDFASSYTDGDNSKVVATDTMKNTVNVLAKQHLGDEIERFAVALSDHFLRRYPQVKTTEIEILERAWDRMEVDGKPHTVRVVWERHAE
jgi:urate oxidase